MRVLGIVGRSGSGKTTLIEAMIPLLRGRGLSVSTLKHSHHSLALDTPGKDSWRHRAAGAEEVMLVAGGSWALLHADVAEPEPPPLVALLARMAQVDLVLVEGFASTACTRIELCRAQVMARPGKVPLWPHDAGIVALATDAPLPGCDRVLLPLNAPATIVQWVMDRWPRLTQFTENGIHTGD